MIIKNTKCHTANQNTPTLQNIKTINAFIQNNFTKNLNTTKNVKENTKSTKTCLPKYNRN